MESGISKIVRIKQRKKKIKGMGNIKGIGNDSLLNNLPATIVTNER